MAPLPVGFSASMPIPPKAEKARNLLISAEYLAERARRSVALGYSKPRWILFCERGIRAGLDVRLYEAKRTASKYVTLSMGPKSFKVRFSNHKPIPSREARNDCDFFVGVTNQTVTTTGDALRAVETHFGVRL